MELEITDEAELQIWRFCIRRQLEWNSRVIRAARQQEDHVTRSTTQRDRLSRQVLTVSLSNSKTVESSGSGSSG